jgi:hypothetical protein
MRDYQWKIKIIVPFPRLLKLFSEFYNENYVQIKMDSKMKKNTCFGTE